MDTKTILGLASGVACFIVAPIITAFVVRVGYRRQLVDLMSGPSLSVPDPFGTPTNPTVRIRPLVAAPRLPAILSGPRPVFRLLLYGFVFWLVAIVIMPTVAPLLGLTAPRTSLVPDLKIVVGVIIVVILILPRVALGYSGLGLYSFFMGSAYSTMSCALLISLGMSIYELIDGTVTTLFQFIVWCFGLCVVVFVLTRALAFAVFVSKLMLWLHVGVSRLPVSQGFRACSFACLCVGILFVPDRNPDLGWFGGVVAWLKLFLALVLPLTFFVMLSLIPLALARQPCPASPGFKVLYLRTFSGKKKTRQFLRTFATHWLNQGPIYVISGPDIATDVMDSSTLAAYANDDLRSAFIYDFKEFRQRFERLRKTPGWDLRYRMEEFRCSGLVWTQVFDALLKECDVVIIDLRGFAKSHRGTAFELFSDLQLDHQGKSLLLIDDETCQHDIQQVVGSAAAVLPGLSQHFAERGVELLKARGGGIAVAHASITEIERTLPKSGHRFEGASQ